MSEEKKVGYCPIFDGDCKQEDCKSFFINYEIDYNRSWWSTHKTIKRQVEWGYCGFTRLPMTMKVLEGEQI